MANDGRPSWPTLLRSLAFPSVLGLSTFLTVGMVLWFLAYYVLSTGWDTAISIGATLGGTLGILVGTGIWRVKYRP